MSGKKIEKILKQNNWKLVRIIGSHYQYQHPDKTGTVTIPMHGNKDLPIFVLKSIERQSGLSLLKR